MLKAYKYRIYPNKQQEEQIRKTFGCCRFVYNQTLAYRKDKYEQEKQSINKTYTPVVCITTGRVFKSIVEAVNCYRISGRGSNIGSCCIGRQKTSGKLNGVPLKWMYLSDFKKLPQEEQEKILANVKEELS